MENENKIEEKVEEKIEPKVETKASPVPAIKAKACKEKLCALWNKDKKTIVAVFALIVLVAASSAYAFWYKKKVDVGQEIVKEKVQKFVSDNVSAGTKVEINEVSKEGDLYKVIVNLDAQEVPLYVTRDGKKLIQNVVDMDQQAGQNADKQAASPEKTEAEQKQDVPEVKLFVMSYCPYGTQMEKGILPVVKALGSKIKFDLEFVDYAMHGQKEVDENLIQHCIQKTQQTKLDDYLECFLKKGEGTTDACMKTAGVNAAQVKTCVTQTDAELKINEKVKDKSAWNNSIYPPFDVNKDDNEKYGVQGSPTLVVNGTQLSAQRDPASILKAVCSGFANAPKECEQKLSTTAPAPGFGEGTAANGANSAAACGQ